MNNQSPDLKIHGTCCFVHKPSSTHQQSLSCTSLVGFKKSHFTGSSLGQRSKSTAAIVWIHFLFNDLQKEQQLCGWLMCGILSVFSVVFNIFFAMEDASFILTVLAIYLGSVSIFTGSPNLKAALQSRWPLFCVGVWRTGAMMTPGLGVFFNLYGVTSEFASDA